MDPAGVDLDLKDGMMLDVKGKISLYESSNDGESSGSGNHSQS